MRVGYVGSLSSSSPGAETNSGDTRDSEKTRPNGWGFPNPYADHGCQTDRPRGLLLHPDDHFDPVRHIVHQKWAGKDIVDCHCQRDLL